LKALATLAKNIELKFVSFFLYTKYFPQLIFQGSICCIAYLYSLPMKYNMGARGTLMGYIMVSAAQLLYRHAKYSFRRFAYMWRWCIVRTTSIRTLSYTQPNLKFVWFTAVVVTRQSRCLSTASRVFGQADLQHRRRRSYSVEPSIICILKNYCFYTNCDLRYIFLYPLSSNRVFLSNVQKKH